MLGRHDHRGAGRAVALLATCFVVAGGAIACYFIAVSMSIDPWRPLAITGACFGGIVFLLWLLRDREPGNTARQRWGWLARERPKIAYRAAPRVPVGDRPPTSVAPPSVESVRAITGGFKTWVPAKDRPATGGQTRGNPGESAPGP